MIYPELKSVLSPDIPDLSKYHPEDSENFGFALQLLIGPNNEEGMEAFQVTVCTPAWLSKSFSKDAIIMGRHYLIVFEYNYERILNRINQYLQSCMDATWEEVAIKISRLGLWEFEDYRDSARD